MNVALFDISPQIDEKFCVWPNDMPLKKLPKLEIEKGHGVNLSAFKSTSHLGAHVNSPLMTETEGLDVVDLGLDYFIGPCEVIEIQANPLSKVTPDQLPNHFQTPRVLIKTNTANQQNPFPEDYAALDPNAIEYLHEKGVILVGIDTPGIDLYKDCSSILSQKCASKYKMAVLECLYLKEVPKGVYELVALPLKLKGFEASPVRAILRK
ncbi:MAG: Kynurenine formamidase [Chlamydiae bacterium]|nr:Kynurenine formamidase [Chlamydiota bacterium]